MLTTILGARIFPALLLLLADPDEAAVGLGDKLWQIIIAVLVFILVAAIFGGAVWALLEIFRSSKTIRTWVGVPLATGSIMLLAYIIFHKGINAFVTGATGIPMKSATLMGALVFAISAAMGGVIWHKRHEKFYTGTDEIGIPGLNEMGLDDGNGGNDDFDDA